MTEIINFLEKVSKKRGFSPSIILHECMEFIFEMNDPNIFEDKDLAKHLRKYADLLDEGIEEYESKK